MAGKLRNLVRLCEWRVDERRRKLGELLRLVANLEDQARRLETELAGEQAIAGASPGEAGFLYGNYAEAVILRRDRIAESIAKTEEEIASAREELNDAYRELKKYQVTEESRRQRKLRETSRKEQAVADELSTQGFLRRLNTGR